jgi:hypothetical protein
MNKKGNYNLHSDTQRHIIFQGFQFKSITTLERPVSGISSIQHRLIQKISFTTLQFDITEKRFTQEAEKQQKHHSFSLKQQYSAFKQSIKQHQIQ